MDVKTLCLGALSFGEATGYDIKKFFECTFSHFFVAGYGSIYPALADLTDKGWVTCRREPQDGKPDRKVYELTEQGWRAFERQLDRTPPNHKVRSEFLVLMFFAHLLPKDKIAALFDERLRGFEQSLARIEEYEAGQNDAGPDAPPGGHFCCGYGKAVLSAARQYLLERREEMIERGLSGEESRRTDTEDA